MRTLQEQVMLQGLQNVGEIGRFMVQHQRDKLVFNTFRVPDNMRWPDERPFESMVFPGSSLVDLDCCKTRDIGEAINAHIAMCLFWDWKGHSFYS